jgi:hypothetical protein
VTYELRAFTRDADAMFQTLSELRANVLDAFNRAGVEIMTPSILAHRDASQLAVPLEQFPDRPPAGGIAVDVRTDGGSSILGAIEGLLDKQRNAAQSPRR